MNNTAIEKFNEALAAYPDTKPLAYFCVRNSELILASLRAVAPAPADQSDAAETGVEEFLFDWSSFPKEIYVRSVMSRHLMTEFRCVAAKLGAEPEVKYLRADLCPTDQSDAGREEIALKDLALFWQGRANALAILDNKRAVSDDMTHEAIKIYMECADELRRALASASSETARARLRHNHCWSSVDSGPMICSICGPYDHDETEDARQDRTPQDPPPSETVGRGDATKEVGK